MSFLNRTVRSNQAAIQFYRKCLRTIANLQPAYQKTYYDLVVLKYNRLVLRAV